MTTNLCSGCGDCCDRIWLAGGRMAIATNTEATMENRVWASELVPLEQPNTYACPKFDRESRSCTTYEDRPPVCSNFPWYGKMPSPPEASHLSQRCTFRAEASPIPVLITPMV